MIITQRQLQRVIRKAINEAKEPMTDDYVLSALSNGKSARSGESFMDIAMDGVVSSDWWKAGDAIMNALWIDDPPVGAEDELADLLAAADPQTGGEIASIGAEWGTRHFRG